MEKITDTLISLKSEGRLRYIPPHRKGNRLLDLCSNDYMGLASRASEWKEEFMARFPNVSMTSSASRLLSIDQDIYQQLEIYLEKLYGRPALLYNSGYHANVGTISALSGKDTLWVVDKLVHASIIDGLKLGGSDFKRFQHNDLSALRKILYKVSSQYSRVIIAVESVYSMDGDISPLIEIVELKSQYPNLLIYVDEAHAVGCFGPDGAGICAQKRIIEKTDVLVGTFGKACASSGAYVICSQELKHFLVNTSRSLIFSTAIAPVNAAWSLFMLEKIAGMDCEREHLAKISEQFSSGLSNITGKEVSSASAIVPLHIGNAFEAVRISRLLENRGILALPIRRPTVPPGGERIRFSLNANISEQQITDLLRIIEEILRSNEN